MTTSNDLLLVTSSPHIHSPDNVPNAMRDVLLALLPALLCGLYFFGLPALGVILSCVVSAYVSELLCLKAMGKEVRITEQSAAVTGLLLAFCLPPALPLWMAALGSAFAIVIVKHLFGGLGQNVFNPALIGRALILISFPKAMTTFTQPVANIMSMDAKTMATPLTVLKEDGVARLLELYPNIYRDLLMGNRAGSLGETATIALLLGAAFLMVKRYITWHVPIPFILTVGVATWIFGGKGALFTGDAMFHMMSGGLILGAFYMATDYVTGPSVRSAQVVFGVACGLLTVLIRLKGGYPEGVMFAILIMNCFAPLLDRGMRSRVFGKAEAKGVKK